MNRLTIKKVYKTNTRYYKPKNVLVSDLTFKLGQYENIDEKIGITYSILVGSLLKGFNTKYNGHVGPYSIEIDLELKCFIDSSDAEHYYFKDYGKTWALTKEELNGEKL